ncbi:MAG: hypothetical protein IV086_04115 [Hyphomonadaceae bacterium]|nr:hypothetical protein [Hyphomonadaceae bacterium]
MKGLKTIAVLVACAAPGACANLPSDTMQSARGIFTGQGFDAEPIIHQSSTGARATSVDLVRQVLCVTRGEAGICPDWRSNEWRHLTLPSADEAALEFEMHPFNDDATKDADARKRYRNAIVGTVLARADANCAAYLNQLRGWQVTQRTGLGIVEIGLDAAGAITQSTTSSRLFSGLSGVATSMSGTIDKEVFSSTAVEVVANHIETSMTAKRTEIVNNLRKSYADYNLSLAIADLQRYYGGCDSRNGLAIMRQQGAMTPETESATARARLAARSVENGAAIFANEASEAQRRADQLSNQIADLTPERDAATTSAARKAALVSQIAQLETDKSYWIRQAETLKQRATDMRQAARELTEPAETTTPETTETPKPEPAKPVEVAENDPATTTETTPTATITPTTTPAVEPPREIVR